MKRIFFFLLMVSNLFAGKDFNIFDAPTKLHEIKRRMIQIRTQLGYKQPMVEIVKIDAHERYEYYVQFDQLWREFVALKPFFKQELSTYSQKILFVAIALFLRKDKERYEFERSVDQVTFRLIQLFHTQEELTQ